MTDQAYQDYLPFEKRSGPKSIVYFTRDLSSEGLLKIFGKVQNVLSGKVAIKLHTGEPHGPNIIPAAWVKELVINALPDSAIVETNTYYEGNRYTTEKHLETIKINGWDFCPVDILDAPGVGYLPVRNGKWFKEMAAENLLNYDSLLVLTHFKGHSRRLRGSNKNIASAVLTAESVKHDSHPSRLKRYVGNRKGRIHGTDDRIHEGCN